MTPIVAAVEGLCWHAELALGAANDSVVAVYAAGQLGWRDVAAAGLGEHQLVRHATVIEAAAEPDAICGSAAVVETDLSALVSD